MSKTDESPSASGREPPRRPFLRDEWRELNAAQLVCIVTGTVAAMFGVFAGILMLLAAFTDSGSGPGRVALSRIAAIPSLVALACAAGAVTFTRSKITRRVARQESGPAVLMALTGLLGIAIAWAIG